jgi:type IV pilus assembly protein PilE
MRCQSSRGFTLIELMVAVILVAILAAIAIPSYSAYVTRGQRAAAKVGLAQAAQYLERNYTTYACYDYDTAATACAATAVLPPSLSSAPNDGGPASYALSVVWPAPIGQGFVLTATPCGDGGAACPGGSKPFTDAECDKLTLDNTGAKTASGTLGMNDCWNR